MKHTKSWAIFGTGIFLSAFLGLALSGNTAAGAQNQMIIGLDMQPATNDPDTLGRLQPCTEAEVGAEISADVFVANIPSLTAWELRLDYDPGVLSVELADYNQMLVSTQPSGSVFPSLFELEKTGRYFMAATEINGTPDSGSGVLAHLTLKAVGPGTSTLTITDSPVSHGPRLIGDGGDPVGDDDGDRIWDGQLTDGIVYVGGDCPEATPIPTPKPATDPGEDPPNDGGSGSGSTSGGGSVAVVDDDPSGDGGGTGPGSNDGGSDDGSPDGGTSGTDGTSDPGGEGAQPGASPGSASSDGLGDIPFVIGGLAMAAIVLGAATLFIFRRRGAW